METTFAFDTLAYARKLKAAGVAAAQAEAHAEAVRDAVVQGFAIKADIRRLEDKIDALAESKPDKADVRILESAIAAFVEGKADKADIQRLEDKIDALAAVKVDKTDVRCLESELKADIRRPEGRFGETASKADLAELKATMLLAVFGAAGALFAALRLFGSAP